MALLRTGGLTRSRVLALLVIVLVASGLGYLRLTSRPESVSVPAGARAGDLVLKPCTYPTEDGDLAADCGTLVVPENRHDPGSRLIALPVVRVRAHTSHPGAPMFYFQGGPGGTNLNFPPASRYADERDVVMVGYRGVDGSVRLDCPEVTASRSRSRDWLSTASLESDAAALRACADRLSSEGVDLAGYTLPQRVDDMEDARVALGYGPVDLIGESFGTRVALVYAWRHPSSVHRSLLVGVNPPGHFLWDAKTTREQLARYAALCARDTECRARTDDLGASVLAGYEDIPSRWGFLPIKRSNVKALTLYGLFNATPAGGGPFAAPVTLDTFLSLEEGDAGGVWLMSLFGQIALAQAQVAGDAAAMALIDSSYVERFFTAPVRRDDIGGASSTFIWMGGKMVHAWPASPDFRLYNQVPDSDVEMLLVGGELDFSTPPQVATRELMPHLRRGQQVVLPSLGHTEDFWTYQPAASTRLIQTYFDTGRVDTSAYTVNRVDFTPSRTSGTLARIVLATLLVMAALTALSLLAVALHVRRRGRFGPAASVLLRSAYAVVIGLGGWLLGALVVLTAMPTVFLGSEPLAVVSVGLPVGLGLFFAWVHWDWPVRAKSAGLGAGLAGALAGAWLGFHATTGLVAVVTSTVGAVLGGNFVLVVLMIAMDRRSTEPPRPRTATRPLRPRPMPREEAVPEVAAQPGTTLRGRQPGDP